MTADYPPDHESARRDRPWGAGAVSDDDIEAWAERERMRRQHWLEGPSRWERLRWAESRSMRPRHPEDDPRAYGPSDEEIDQWAAEEKARRQRWVEGPSELERLRWADRESRRRRRRAEAAEWEDDDWDPGRRAMADADRAVEGLVSAILSVPYRTLGQLIEMGEDARYQRTKRRRIRY